MTSALRHAAFRRLAALYTANALLEWFGSVALMVVVYDATNSPVAAAGMLLCKQVAPALVVAPLSSRLDAVSLRAALCAVLAVHAGALLVLSVVGYGAALFALSVVAGSSSVLARGAIRAGVARALQADDLRAANAVLNLVMGLVLPLAPLVAAGAITAAGAPAALTVAAAGFAVMALVALALPRVAVRAAEPVADAGEAEAPRRTGAVPVSWLLALAGIATMVAAIDEPSLLAFSRDSVGAGVGGYGAIFGAQACGIAVGSLLFARLLAWPMLRIYGLATILLGVGLVGMGLAPSIELACVFAALAGVGVGMDWVALVTAVQESTPRGREALVATRLELAGMVGPGVGIALGGLLAEVGSPRVALVVPGVLALAVLACLIAALRLRRAQRSQVLVLSPSIHGGSA